MLYNDRYSVYCFTLRVTMLDLTSTRGVRSRRPPEEYVPDML